VTPDPRLKQTRLAVVKLTNRCNIRCKYCYEAIVNQGTDMSPAIFERMLEAILSSTSEATLLLVLHGGEPTILSEEWFEANLTRAYDLAAEYQKQLEISIQTNLIEISDEKLRIFQRFGVSVGGSLDNPNLLVESLRPLATKAVNTYRRATSLGLRVGLLASINSSNIRAMPSFCEWLLHDLGVRHFKANIAYAVGAGLDLTLPTAEALFNAQRDIVEFMLTTDGALIEDNLAREIVRFFESYVGGRTRPGALCDDRRCGAGSKVIGISPDGSLLPCGRFAWNETHHYLGAMHEPSDDEVSEFFEKIDRFFQMEPQNWQYCDSCEARDICNFGCQAFIVRSKLKRNVECRPTQLRFEYYRANAARLQGLYEHICKFEDRVPMSPFEQKVSKLLSMTRPDQHPAILAELNATVQGASVAL
jgi:uncharacterized protein